MTRNSDIFIHIKSDLNLPEKLKAVFTIIDAARSKASSEILTSFLDSFDLITNAERTVNTYLLERFEWEYAISKCNWEWVGAEVNEKKAIIHIRHQPKSNYIDLLHVLMYVGFRIEDIEVEDGLFGTYRLVDTNMRT